MTTQEIRQVFELEYNQQTWATLLTNLFTSVQLLSRPQPVDIGKQQVATQCLALGHYAVDDYTKIGLFEVQLSAGVKLTRNRVGLRNLVKTLTQQVAGAMVVFVQGKKWRFSYISKRKVRNTQTNTIEDKATAPKRFTYLFGENEKALTAAQRFAALMQKQQNNLFLSLTLSDFEEAFSVEKLSKEFFKAYKSIYEDFVTYLTGKSYQKVGNKLTETQAHAANFQLQTLFGREEKQARDFVKRMMGRIVFLYFIQKKGWLACPITTDAQGKTQIHWGAGNPNYLYDLFHHSPYKDDFYKQELIPLFFKTLNNPHSQTVVPTIASYFPYLNGGLFDDSQDKKYHPLVLPADLFYNLFEKFNEYNFTVYEDAPDEHTVAVDPEMLGHIFENLLEDNKDKGAFYTPKEVVHYMCRESLAVHLADKLGGLNYDTILKLIQQVELGNQEETWVKRHATDIILVLEKIKICDPAIGSGAFPMGILQEIFNLMVVLYGYKGWGKVNEVDIKKHIIQESIYGVDIDSGAVDIARLRCWLSLVVDEIEPQALPNLDFKIMKGDSLKGLRVIDVNVDKEFEQDKVAFFEESNPETKWALKQKINTHLNTLLETANEYNHNYQSNFDFRFFFSEVFHGNEAGFDIVIGNPPYGAKLTKEEKEI
ncbi:MAG: Eco57I restriction-modification methylase domain-containing protein, partial [Bacteroidia bacterium]